MLLDRRTFAAGSAALLSGCATVGGAATFSRTARRCRRSKADARPGDPHRRRPAGPTAARASSSAPKRWATRALVHNYGHGGGGITLSWGTSKLATELGAQGHSGAVAVLGSGVMGLSTARLVQEAGFPVTIYAAALPPDTTSNIAGGQIHPMPCSTTTRSRRRSWPSSPARSIIAGGASRSWSATITASAGCRPMSRRDSPEAQLLATFPPINRMLTPGRASVPVDQRRSATTRCTSRPAAISGR